LPPPFGPSISLGSSAKGEPDRVVCLAQATNVCQLAREMLKGGVVKIGSCQGRVRRGQTLVEYALLIALLSVAVVGSLMAFRSGVDQSLADSNSELQKAFTGN